MLHTSLATTFLRFVLSFCISSLISLHAQRPLASRPPELCPSNVPALVGGRSSFWGAPQSGGSGGAHAASTGTESTQGYKPTSSLIKYFISTILLVVLFSSIVENAYAYVLIFMFMLVSVTSFLWIKSCCKMARYSTIQKLDLVLALLRN